MFIMPKNEFLRCFHHQFLKTALETQIKAYAVVAYAQHAEKRVFALFSSSIFEICSRNANKAICSRRKCSTCRKNAFLQCFQDQFLGAATETQLQRSQLFNMHINAFLQCFHHKFLKTASETQIKAYADFANVKNAEKTRFSTVFIIYFRKLL